MTAKPKPKTFDFDELIFYEAKMVNMSWVACGKDLDEHCFLQPMVLLRKPEVQGEMFGEVYYLQERDWHGYSRYPNEAGNNLFVSECGKFFVSMPDTQLRNLATALRSFNGLKIAYDQWIDLIPPKGNNTGVMGYLASKEYSDNFMTVVINSQETELAEVVAELKRKQHASRDKLKTKLMMMCNSNILATSSEEKKHSAVPPEP